jgi:hypothetical protein
MHVETEIQQESKYQEKIVGNSSRVAGFRKNTEGKTYDVIIILKENKFMVHSQIWRKK